MLFPDGGYVQGAKCEPLNRYDFFDSFYDCLGKETLNYSNVEGRTSVFINNTVSEASDKVFGFVPRYFGLKIKKLACQWWLCLPFSACAVLALLS